LHLLRTPFKGGQGNKPPLSKEQAVTEFQTEVSNTFIAYRQQQAHYRQDMLGRRQQTSKNLVAVCFPTQTRAPYKGAFSNLILD
jgi:hypothetical protein